MIDLGYQIIDLHTHLRDDIPFHTQLAKEAGIGKVLYMPNTNPCLDNIANIKSSLKKKRYIEALPVGAITVGRKGKKLVDVEAIKSHVVGFSDDGDCLMNLDLLEKILKTGVLVLAHLEPETEMAREYLKVFKKTGGKLHFQHISKAETVKLVRQAKKDGVKITCETCPHYFTYSNEVEDKAVNPPLGSLRDVMDVKKGLADGTIDVIASDYAPLPRPKGTGIASFSSFIPQSYGLVLEGVLTEKQLREKISINPAKIIS